MLSLFRRIAPLSLVLVLSWGTIAAGGGFTGVVDFSSRNCGPCQQMAPIVARLQREGLPIKGVSIDGSTGLAQKYGISSIPAFVLFVDGEEVDRIVGAMSEADLRRFVARVPQRRPADQPDSPIPVNLGDVGSLPRPQPQPLQQEPEPKVADRTSPLEKLWPFGRNESTPPTVRGSDAELGESEPLADASPGENPGGGRSASSDPMSASTRIRVFIGDHINLGSGTVVSSRPGNTLIVTCGHIFRGFRQDSKIEVDLFDGQQSQLYVARLEKFDLEADVGLIAIPTSAAVPTATVAGRDALPAIGQPVACIGCSGGDLPTRDQLRITAVDKYEGPNNIECTGIPVQGRSGGGLFDMQGQLVGVCIAADPKEQRGIYAGLYAVHALLETCGLTELYQPAQPPRPVLADAQAVPANDAADALAATSPPPQPNQPSWGQQRQPEAPAVPRQADPVASSPASHGSKPLSPPTSIDAGGAEVVVIIRDRQNPDAANKVVIIHQASPKFLAYLNGELDETTSRLPLDPAVSETSQKPAAQPEPLAAMDRHLRAAGHSLSEPLPLVERRAKSSLAPTSLSTPRARPYVRSASSR